ncbi:MAG: penicillin-binding protein, partial [Comamonas sp.]|nr:penicillin-binding protein [Candidatus Comamonas equi]
QFGQQWITRFGFDAAKHPPYLTMALGAGAVTPMQLVAGFSVFANGGHRVNPWLIAKITDPKGQVLSEFTPLPLAQQPRAIDERNAFVMNSMLQHVARSGTAARAQATLKRPDLYGKTGTTNDAVDAWFAGFQPTIAAVTWIGYDTPRNLGSRETGGGLSLPIWINFMQHALKGVPVAESYPVPPGVTNIGGEWYFDEFVANAGVASLGMDEASAGTDSDASTAAPAPEERSRILDLFRE